MTAKTYHEPSADHPRSLAILGSTGSVGTQTVDLVAREPEKYKVKALSARKNVKLLAEQTRQLEAPSGGLPRPQHHPRGKCAAVELKRHFFARPR